MSYNKYHAKRTELDGITFDSKKEADRYAILKILEKGNLIKQLELQKRFLIVPSIANNFGQKEKAAYYVADFYYFDNEKGHYVAEDVKGIRTPLYKLKRKLFIWNNPTIEFIET